MLLHPDSLQRQVMTSPPPSKALLALQKQGLELAVSRSPSLLQVSESHASARSTPSDRDKPLPLEPFENKRRSSSVYSTDTTISNIIHLYGGIRELDDIPPVPTLHHPQAYRDTIAPLLIRRFSLSPSPSLPPSLAQRGESVSNLSLRSAASRAVSVPASNKAAPTFVEFSRNLENRRNELVSPLSASSPDHYRQAAYDQLAPPSPQVSSVALSISFSQTPPLPDSMSAPISDIEESDLLPSPLGRTSSRSPSPVFGDREKDIEFDSARCDEAHADRPGDDLWANNLNENWFDDGLVSQSPVAEPAKPGAGRSLKFRKSSSEREQERAKSYATTKHSSLTADASSGKKSGNSSARSSLQQGVASLLRSLSLSKAARRRSSDHQQEAPREKQLAVPATPYQVYGAEIWSDKTKKKQRAMQGGAKRGKSVDLVNAYQSGQSQLVGVIEGAKRKLTRGSSQKRRRKLKQSIIFVGPAERAEVMHAMERFAGDEGPLWI